MLVGRVFRLRVTLEQDAALFRWSGICRSVWNTGLEQRRHYRQGRSFIGYAQQCRELAEAKADPDLVWLAAAPGHVLQQALKDLDRACRTAGTWRVHWRSSYRWQPSMRFPEGGHMRVQRLSKRWGRVNLPRLGQVKFRMTRELDGAVHSATVSWRDGGWQVSFLVEDGVLEVLAPEDDSRPAVGIDRGVKVALALSDGRMLDRDFTTGAEQEQVTRLQRQLSRQQGPRAKPGKAVQRATPKARGRRQVPSKRWLATKTRIAKIQARQRRRRDDFLAKAAHALAGDHSVVVLEKLNTAGMTRRPKPKPVEAGGFERNYAAQKAGLNRAILGKGWGKFTQQLEHQARYTGTRIVTVPAAFTSQRCHECGHTEPGNRESQADFRCIRCGHTAHADTNAARNILAVGLAVTGRASPALAGSVNHQAA